MILLCLFRGMSVAGTLTGRIIDEKGKSLANTLIEIEIANEENDNMVFTAKTNVFGSYKVEIPDGKYNLRITINKVEYITDEILIYSPVTKQNWRLDKKNKKLIKIK